VPLGPPPSPWGNGMPSLERNDRGVDGPGVEGDSRLGELLEV